VPSVAMAEMKEEVKPPMRPKEPDHAA
jgi:hypothetical protein